MNAQRRRTPSEDQCREIMAAALQVFARHGYERATTREIAEEAGVSEGTVYIHFRNKQELLFALLEASALVPLASVKKALKASDERQAVRGFLEERFSLWERNLPLLKVTFGEALFNPRLAEVLCCKMMRPLAEVVEEFMAERTESGKFRAGDPTLEARALIGLVFAFNILWEALLCRQGKRFPRAQVIDQLTSLFLDGIRAEGAAAGAKKRRTVERKK